MPLANPRRLATLPLLALLFVAAAAGCGDDDSTPTGAAGTGGGPTGQGGGGTGTPVGSGGGSTASSGGDGGASSGSSSGGGEGGAGTGGATASTTTGELDDLEELLARLRADRDGTLLEESLDGGWPVRVAEGRVVVSTEPAYDEVAGDFDAWVGTALTADEGFAWAVVPDQPGAFYKLKSGEEFTADPWARAFTYDDFGEITFVAPPASAHLERWPLVEDDALAPRTVRAWVPAEAATHVLYVHDGQNLFDPDAFFGGWQLQDVAPAGMLIIGVDNTFDRMDEYTHVPDDIGGGDVLGGLGDAYADYLQEVVRPLVDARYGEPDVVGTMGSSLGGLISLHVALRHTGEYAFAASLSGTLGWGSIGASNETMIERYEAAGLQPFAIYLDSGGGGDTCVDTDGDGTDDDDPTAADNYCETLQMRDVLAAEGWVFDEDLFHWWEPGASHDEAAWAARVEMPLGHFAAID